MGLFDSIYAICPKCGASVEFQSKAGECNMTEYSSDRVPAAIAADINGESIECKCGAVITIGEKYSSEFVDMPISAT